MREVVLDGLFYAALTAALAVSGREFRLYNLAGGMWAIYGGWASAFVVGFLSSTPQPINALWLFAFFPLAGLQIFSPLLLRTVLRDSPLAYMFVSLGVALAGTGIAATVMLRTHGATISISYQYGWISAGVISLVVVALVWVLFRTSRWASVVLSFRIAADDSPAWRQVCLLLAVELCLLVIIGAAGYSVHKGILGASELYSVIPILALVAADSKIPRACLLSFTLVLFSHSVGALLPSLAQFSIAIAVFALLVIGGMVSTPRGGWPAAVRPTESIPARSDHDRWYENQVTAGMLSVIVLVGVSTYLLGISSPPLHRMSLGLALITVSWIAQGHLGVTSIIWPGIGVTYLYLWLAVAETHPFLILLVSVASLVFWACYLWWLRVLDTRSAMVIDLAMLVFIHQLVLGASSVSGTDNVRHFQLPFHFTAGRVEILIAQTGIVLTLLAVVFAAGRVYWLRGAALSLSNLKLGFQHGFSSRSNFLKLGGALTFVSMCVSTLYHLAFSALSPAELSLIAGLTVLLFGDLLTRWGPIIAFSLVFALYVIVDLVSSGSGEFVNIVLGLLFLFVAYSSRTIGGSRGRA